MHQHKTASQPTCIPTSVFFVNKTITITTQSQLFFGHSSQSQSQSQIGTSAHHNHKTITNWTAGPSQSQNNHKLDLECENCDNLWFSRTCGPPFCTISNARVSDPRLVSPWVYILYIYVFCWNWQWEFTAGTSFGIDFSENTNDQMVNIQ